MTNLLKDLEAVPVIAYAWRKEGMKGWALGHNPPTPNMLDFGKYEVRELTFRTHHAEIAEAVRDARRLDWMERNAINITLDGRMHRCMQIGASRISIDVAQHNSAREDGSHD